MINKNKTEDKERVLRYLIRKGSVQNTYKIARELAMERVHVLEILHELAKEDKVRLRSGSVRAVTKELSEEEIFKTKSEVEELKEKVEILEKWIGVTFKKLDEAIHVGNQKILRINQSKKNNLVKPEEVKIKA